MKQTTDNEDLMVSYLLGELPEEQQLRLEERFFTDDEYFQQLSALEDELFYDYAAGGLAPEQRIRFEQRFLISPQARRKVELASAVLEKTAEARAHAPTAEPAPRRIFEEKRSLWQSLAAFFQNPVMQFSLAAAGALLLIGAAGLFYQTLRLRSQVELLETARVRDDERRALEVATAGKRRDEMTAQLEIESNKRAQLEQELAALKAQAALDRENQPASSGTIFSFILPPGLVRDVDGPKRFSIPPGTGFVRLQLNLKQPRGDRGYRATLQTLDGAELWNRDLARSTSAAVKRSISLNLPAKLLPPGDYVIALKGRTAAGELEEIDEYYFTVVKQ